MMHLAAPEPAWRHPDDDPPPHGRKILMLSPYGLAQTGDWYPEAAAWMPLPDVPRDLKERLKKEGRLK